MKLLVTLYFLLSAALLSAQRNNAPAPVMDTIFTRPTVLASYPGGDSAWKVYLKKHLKYPRKAWWSEIETDITVRVVINKNGSIARAEHLTVVGYGFEKEAVRLVLKSGRWLPATYNGKPVMSEGQLVIPFRLR